MSAVQQMLVGAGGGDPYFSNVVLLTHLDGANQSWTAIDNSSYANSLTFYYVNDPDYAISTINPKFGSASIRNVSGTGNSSVYTPTSTLFAMSTLDWTVEYWVNCTDYGWGFKSHFSIGGYYFAFYNNNALQYNFGNGTQNPSISGMANGVWQFIAVVRSGTTINIFIDGVLRSTNLTGAAANMGNSATNFQILTGTPTPTYLDEFRFTKGVARYTANFTPPTAAFPNS